MSPDELSPRAAAAELERTTGRVRRRAHWPAWMFLAGRVRRRAHWPAWMFLALAAVNFAFFLIVGSGDRSVGNALIPLPTLIAVAVFVVASRQPVIGRGAQDINKPVALAGVVTVVAGLIIDQAVLPRHFTWWLVLLVALMVTPYLVGAWRWLRR